MTLHKIISSGNETSLKNSFTFTQDVSEQLSEFKKFFDSKKDVKRVLVTYVIGEDVTMEDLSQDMEELTQIFSNDQNVEFQMHVDDTFKSKERIIKVSF